MTFDQLVPSANAPWTSTIIFTVGAARKRCAMGCAVGSSVSAALAATPSVARNITLIMTVSFPESSDEYRRHRDTINRRTDGSWDQLRFDPTEHVLGTVQQHDASAFDPSQEAHSIAIDERHLRQVEHDTMSDFAFEQVLQSGRLLLVQQPAK